MVKNVWVVMYKDGLGNHQVGSVHSSENGAQQAANDPKYKDKHAWHDGPFEEKD